MAVLIMRLKLFMTPHLCIASALIAHPKLFGGDKISNPVRASIFVGILALLITRGKCGHLDKQTYRNKIFLGMPNVQQQLNIKGEYSNPDQEMLFDWIQSNTKQGNRHLERICSSFITDAVFAGTMPVMANVKLTTLRPIINHPHYEHVGIRWDLSSYLV